jgi:hypothetical protein
MIIKSNATGQGDKEADAAPRGNAKSTWVDLVLALWATAFKLRHFILIVSDTASQAEDFIQFLKADSQRAPRPGLPELSAKPWRTRSSKNRVGSGRAPGKFPRHATAQGPT